MKRFFALFLLLCLLLCACTPAAEDSAAVPTEPATIPEVTDAPTVPEETEAPPTEAVTEPPAPTVCRNPLNGAVLEEPYTGRPVAVTINNVRACLPHYGISKADILYEVETEAGITRFLALFSDPSQVDALGSVRSTRTFFNCISVSYDAVLFHCGGSKCSLKAEYDISGETIKDWIHVNQSYNPSYFYRDSSRLNSGYAVEHTLFTSGERLVQALEDKGYNVPSQFSSYGLQFDEEATPAGASASVVTVNFKGGKETIMTYNTDTGLYEASQYGDNLYDAGADLNLAFRNVLVLYADHWGVFDGNDTHSYYTILGSGKGHFACNGQIVPILWQRDSLYDTYTYTLEDGTPLTFGVGTTYVAIASDTTPVDYQ